ncbi:hypothetical protein MATL_G00077070 [Megalops atlanticus]|uniref:Protein shisa-5 n=1 Tax=Megalops atlanticus TaxID=7932 RepID=A0A9D3Q8V5_MEGAT|nr:hypothetical protein MATL_G00077070 [Megalops atlanticus]
MASTPCLVFVLCLSLISLVEGEDCSSYFDSNSRYHSKKDCPAFQFCCGDCEERYCCSNFLKKFDEDEQRNCVFGGPNKDILSITSGVVGLVILIILIISCCVCPCCCLYKMCRKPTPVVATTTHTTTVTHTPYPQQPNPAQAYQGAQYPGYQPVPVQPGYGGQPVPTAPYQGQPYSPAHSSQFTGPPPPYQEPGPGYPSAPVPYSQAGYDVGHPAYPLQPPAQPGYPPQPDYNSTQPAYNPAFVEPPKTGY